MAELADHIASGNLTAGEMELRNKDEIGDLAQSLNQMIQIAVKHKPPRAQ